MSELPPTDNPKSQDSLSHMLAGPGLMVLARVGGALAGMLFTMMLTRSMGAAGTGQVSVAISLGMVLALACTLNIENGAVRFMVQDLGTGNLPRVAGYIKFSRGFILKVSVLVTVLALFALWIAGYPLTSPLYLAVLSGPILGWMRLGAGIAQGFSRPVLSVLPRTLLRPLFMVFAVGGWLVLVGTPNPWTATLLFLLTSIMVLMAQDMMLRRDIVGLAWGLGDQALDITAQRDWIKIGLTLGLNVLFIEYSIYLTVLFAALVLPAAETARLDVLLKLIALVRFGLISINQYFMPRMSRAMGNNNRPALERLIAISGIMRLAVTAVGGVGFILFGTMILGMFGPEFAGDQPYLLLLLLDTLLIAVLGPGSNIVGLSKQPHRMLPILLLTLVTMCVGTLLGGYFYGLAGVITVTILTRLVWQIAVAAQARAITGVDTTMASLPRYLRHRQQTPGE